MYTYKMYMTWQEKTKKMAMRRETNALSANICTHAQIKTSTERKLFGKKPTARISPLFVPLYPQLLLYFGIAATVCIKKSPQHCTYLTF